MSDKIREFENTHKWLTFTLDLRSASYRMWMLIGEAVSKCENIAGVPLAPEVAEELNRIYLSKGAWSSSAIEGNTLTEEQAYKQISGKLVLPLSQEYLAQEIQNIVDACNELSIDAVSGDSSVDMTVSRICRLNELVLRRLKTSPEVRPGEIRQHSVSVGNYRGAPAADCEYLLQRLCTWLNSSDFLSEQFSLLALGLLKAILAHVYINWIHPFADGNGRTARLVEYYLLLCAGVPKPAAHILSNRYNLTRTEYYRQLDLSFRPGMTLLPFIEYALQGFVDGLKVQLETIRQYQWEVAWREHIYKLFDARTSKGDLRRFQLLLDLSRCKDSVPLSSLTQISPRIAAQYAGMSSRTIQRDIEELKEDSLIDLKNDEVRARKESILAFLPERRV